MSLLLVASAIGYLIGLVLGLLGGGGSILTVPALVYVIGQSPQVAVTASLVIVGANSAMGAMMRRTSGTLRWRVALIFGGSGMLMSYWMAGLSKQFSPTVLLVLFGLLMLTVGILMMRPMPIVSLEHDPHLPTIVGAGMVVGALTGLLGVGGGFLIVPALVMIVGLPMQHAIGTSLIVIFMNSFAGLLGHLNGDTPDFHIISIFLTTGLLGTFSGTKLATKIQSTFLQRLFAVFVIGLALVLLADNLNKLL